jgi:uncharacterized protein YggE
VSVTALDPAPDKALAEVTVRQATVDAVLDEVGVAAEARRTVGATVSEEWEYEQRSERRALRGYRATSSTVVRLVDHALVGVILRRTIAEAGATVGGPVWQVLPTNPGHAEACGLAAVDARAKAEAYAASLGVRLGRLVEATEPGSAPRVFARAVSYSPTMTGAFEELDVSGGQLDVTATIDVTFDLLDA